MAQMVEHRSTNPKVVGLKLQSKFSDFVYSPCLGKKSIFLSSYLNTYISCITSDGGLLKYMFILIFNYHVVSDVRTMRFETFLVPKFETLFFRSWLYGGISHERCF